MGNDSFFAAFDALDKREWLDKIESDLKGKKPEELKKDWQDLEIDPFADKSDLKKSSFSFRSRGDWFIRQAFCFDPKANTNKRILHALNEGVNNLEIAGIDTEEDLKISLKGVNPEYIRTDLKLGSWLQNGGLEAYEDWASSKEIEGSWNYDPLNHFYEKGEFYSSEKEDIEFIKKFQDIGLKNFQWLEVNTAKMHDEGAYASTEMAIALAMFNEYLGQLDDPSKHAGKISFTLGLGVNYFLELGKLRSFRSLAQSVAREYAYEGDLFIHARTGLWNFSSYDRHNNLLRTCTEAMAAVIGGVDALSILPFDISLKTDHHFGAHLARMQQQMLAEESFFNKVDDPVSGSYFIEKLCGELEQKAWDKFKRIEAEGGYLKAQKQGYIRSMIDVDQAAQKAAFDSGELPILGLNLYPNEEEQLKEKIDESYQRLGSNIEKQRNNG